VLEVDLGSGEIRSSSWFRSIQQVKFDVGAWGFQLRGVSGKPDGPSVAEAQRDKEDAV
jgi:hypothetical protein